MPKLPITEQTLRPVNYVHFPSCRDFVDMRCRKIQHLFSTLLIAASVLPLSAVARPFVLFLYQDDLSDPTAVPNYPSGSDDVTDFVDFPESETKPDSVLDHGSWSPLFESDPNLGSQNPKDEMIYYDGVRKMVEAASTGEFRIMEGAVVDIEASTASGQPQGQSVLGFLYSMGMGKEKSDAKAFLYHNFAAQGGNIQSKMALAFTYYRQEMHDKAVALYAELAEVAVNSFLISKDSPVVESIRIHNGAEENKEALRRSRGEDDEDFQILEYQAQKGNAAAMSELEYFTTSV